MAEQSQTLEIDVGSNVWALTFSTNGKHIASGNGNDVKVLCPEDGRETGRMTLGPVNCLAMSNDDVWIAAGTVLKAVLILDAKTCRQVWKHQDVHSIYAVDFSPDSTKLISGSAHAATIWDVATHEQVRTLDHRGHSVRATKYSPQGDQIATGTWNTVRVWDGNDGHLLVVIEAGVASYYSAGLAWFNNHLLALSASSIKQLDTSTSSMVAEWTVPSGNMYSCIALPKHGRFIAYAAYSTVVFLDLSTHAQLALIQHTRDIYSIAFSPDDKLLAIGGEDKIIRIHSVSHIINSTQSSRHIQEDPIPAGNIASDSSVPSHLPPTFSEPDVHVDSPMSTSLTPPSRLHATLQEPNIQINDAALESWKNDELENVDALLTATISESDTPSHHALASRALVRARLQKWDGAFEDAELAIGMQPSIIAFVAKSLAHVGNGERDKGYRTCDIAFEHFHSSHVTFLLLIKAIVVFMAQEHIDAISRLDDLIATVRLNSAYMYLLLGNSQMEHSDYEGAIRSFEHARTQMRDDAGAPLFMVSLMTGWKFNNLDLTTQQRRCQALYAMGRTSDAADSLLEMVNTLSEKVYSSGPITKWVSDFAGKCLSTVEDDGHAASNAHGNPQSLYVNPTPLLREWAKSTLTSLAWKDALFASAHFAVPRFTVYQTICECLETIDCVADAVKCFCDMMSELGGEIYTSGPMSRWVCDFTERRLSAHRDDDATSNANRDSATPTTHTSLVLLLREWAKAKLMRASWKDDVTLAAAGFNLPNLKVEIYRAVCDQLEIMDRLADAVKCLHEMTSELGEKMELHDEHLAWVTDFKQRSTTKLNRLGDEAADARRYGDAISHYSTALSLASSSQGILIKRGDAWLANGSWEEALNDANQVITLDPSSLWGYKMRHTALHQGGDYDSAVDALELMLKTMAVSDDLDIQMQADQYTSPSTTRAKIRKIVQRTIRRLPRVLINTKTGRLHNRTEQAAAFESLPVFKELVSSATTRIDKTRFKREVQHYFRYVMLSHKWEDNEPLYQQMVHTAVYELDESPTHDKLQTFCKIVRDAGFEWAWSDTCCINKLDHFVLQEALVAMFRWYQGSAMVIVFLRGVRSSSPRGALAGSTWNTRAWTLQEYIAAKVVRFYTEEWIVYRDLDVPNHKESQEIISEMEQATGISFEQLMALRPGLSNIREKLRLASTRETTWVEDAAYSLLGIFSAMGISAIYGEREVSLGRLLANILTRSGDVGILAWTGEPNRFNSCLPARIAVFNGSPTSHLPLLVSDSEIEHAIPGLHEFDAAVRLYDTLNKLPAPRFAESRMTLSCIVFQLPSFTAHRTTLGRVYRTDTISFGMLEIRTRHDLSRIKPLYLVHPWLETLLQHDNVHSGVFIEDDASSPLSPFMDDEDISDEEIDDGLSLPDSPVLSSLVGIVPVDKETGARRLAARLRQPFGAILLTPTGRRATDYRRVATDSLIIAQFQESVSLAEILDNVRTLDVL